MSTQLEQILGYLDKDGVTEIVIAVGRPIAMKQKGAYANLTTRPLTTAMLWAFVEGSEIAPVIPHGDGSTEPADLEVGKRRLRSAPVAAATRSWFASRRARATSPRQSSRRPRCRR